MFKILRGLSPDILREVFFPKISFYNLRRNNAFEIRQFHSAYHDTELPSILGPKIWDLVLLELKQLECLEVLKLKIKKWIPFDCPCRLCRTYIQLYDIIFFIIYIVYTIIYLCKFVDFFSFFIYLFNDLFLFTLLVLLELFSYVPSWRIDNNFKCLFQIIMVV